MGSMKKALSTAAIALLMGASALVATAGTASARVVCGADGDCWHTDAAPPRVPGMTFTAHPDDWYFHQNWSGSNNHYRDYHEGRGYYKGGVWITL